MTETTTVSSAIGVGRGGRMSRQRKRDAVLRLLRADEMETVSRSLGVTAATLTSGRDSFLAGGEAALAARPTDGETLESERLKARLGDMLLKHELLEQKITSLEGGRPLARRRWKR
jgi:transposase